jgi:hypothetical protein
MILNKFNACIGLEHNTVDKYGIMLLGACPRTGIVARESLFAAGFCMI